MKQLTQYIQEKLQINKDSKVKSYQPKTRKELKELIDKLIKERGNECNLNDIDVSQITDMCFMFQGSKFNGDISKWDVSNVTDMHEMFNRSEFNRDISKWDVSPVTDMYHMFRKSPLEKNPPKWYKK